jgi:anti-anti-sigma factor
MGSQIIQSRDENGVRIISFNRDEQGKANQELVRLYFADDFLPSTAEVHRLILDLTGVASLDSAGLGPLVQKLREVREHNGSMALAGVQALALKEIFALTRFDKVFPIYVTAQEAMAAMAKSAR